MNAQRLIWNMQKLGCSVPEDKSVIATGGVPRQDMVIDNLTRINIAYDTIGRECARIVINNGDRLIHKVLPPKMEAGGTVAAPKVS